MQQLLQAGELAGPVVNALKARRKVESLCTLALTDVDYQAFFTHEFFKKFRGVFSPFFEILKN